MDFFNIITTGLLAVESDKPTLFPFPFSFHLVFAVISFIFFMVSFLKFKRPYQLLFAIAIPLSLLLWAAEFNRGLYYGLGAVELLLVLAALVSSIILKPKKQKEDKASKPENNSGSTEK